MKTRSEELIPKQIDGCAEDLFYKVGIGAGVGLVAGLALLKGRSGRFAMTTFGAGVGVGSSWEKCGQRLREAKEGAHRKAEKEMRARATGKRTTTGPHMSAPEEVRVATKQGLPAAEDAIKDARAHGEERTALGTVTKSGDPYAIKPGEIDGMRETHLAREGGD